MIDYREILSFCQIMSFFLKNKLTFVLEFVSYMY